MWGFLKWIECDTTTISPHELFVSFARSYEPNHIHVMWNVIHMCILYGMLTLFFSFLPQSIWHKIVWNIVPSTAFYAYNANSFHFISFSECKQKGNVADGTRQYIKLNDIRWAPILMQTKYISTHIYSTLQASNPK